MTDKFLKLKPLQDLDVGGKTVLVRTGFDVSVAGGKVKDGFRIAAALPTLKLLAEARAKTVILSHRGRPQAWDENYSLAPVAAKLAELWGRKFVTVPPGASRLPEYAIAHLYFFPHHFEDPHLAELLAQMGQEDAAVLENLRFDPGEKANDPKFAKLLANFGQVYVNEAFSVCHREETSVAALPKLLPAAAGLGLLAEVNALSKVLFHPRKPVVVMMGGVKLSDKAEVLEHLVKTADYVLLGGGLANLFLKVRGFEIGQSVWEEGGTQEKLAARLLRDYKDRLKLPLDVIVSRSKDGEPECVKVDKVKRNQMILDIGPETIGSYSAFLKQGQTLIWGGPLGLFEKKSFSHGTFALAWLFAARSAHGAYGVAGGGQTLEVIQRLRLARDISFVSTGGGAMLDFLAGKSLPGLEVLKL